MLQSQCLHIKLQQHGNDEYMNFIPSIVDEFWQYLLNMEQISIQIARELLNHIHTEIQSTVLMNSWFATMERMFG